MNNILQYKNILHFVSLSGYVLHFASLSMHYILLSGYVLHFVSLIMHNILPVSFCVTLCQSDYVLHFNSLIRYNICQSDYVLLINISTVLEYITLYQSD